MQRMQRLTLPLLFILDTFVLMVCHYQCVYGVRIGYFSSLLKKDISFFEYCMGTSLLMLISVIVGANPFYEVWYTLIVTAGIVFLKRFVHVTSLLQGGIIGGCCLFLCYATGTFGYWTFLKVIANIIIISILSRI